jgi:GT2 family glycosyltransferase
MTDLSIIIVSYKGWVPLTKCLEELNTFSGKNFTTEVIIVDNKSDDETIYQLEDRFSKFRFIHNAINGGFANGCNLGAKNAKGEFLLFLNPDTVACESELEKLLNIARKNTSFGIVSSRQVNERGKESIASGPFPNLLNLTGFQRMILNNLAPHTSYLTPEITFPDWISGSIVLIKKEIFEKINGFDEDYWMYFEDVDLCRRVRNIPLEIVCCKNITIEHNHGGSSRINLKTASLTKTEVYISRHVYISKHKRGFNKFLIQSFLVFNNLINGVITAFLGLLFFFIPKAFLRTVIFIRLMKYYIGALLRFSWISPHSVNFK